MSGKHLCLGSDMYTNTMLFECSPFPGSVWNLLECLAVDAWWLMLEVVIPYTKKLLLDAFMHEKRFSDVIEVDDLSVILATFDSLLCSPRHGEQSRGECFVTCHDRCLASSTVTFLIADIPVRKSHCRSLPNPPPTSHAVPSFESDTIRSTSVEPRRWTAVFLIQWIHRLVHPDIF